MSLWKPKLTFYIVVRKGLSKMMLNLTHVVSLYRLLHSYNEILVLAIFPTSVRWVFLTSIFSATLLLSLPFDEYISIIVPRKP